MNQRSQPLLFDLGSPAAIMLWHYTDRHAVPRIVRSGHLRPDGGKAATKLVWFSAQQLVEPTASACWAGDLQAGRVYRFGLPKDTAGVVRWDSHISLMSYEGMGLAATGVQMRANPDLWFTSDVRVPIASIEAFEGWDGARWTPLPRWDLLPLPRRKRQRARPTSKHG